MGKLLVVLLALLAPSLAAATPMQDQHGKWWNVLIPPPHWLKKPYLGKVAVYYHSEDLILDICSDTKAEPFGCSFPDTDECLIYIVKGLPDAFRNTVLRHETAHCHGWGADHPMTGPDRADSLPDWPDKPKTWFAARWPD